MAYCHPAETNCVQQIVSSILSYFLAKGLAAGENAARFLPFSNHAPGSGPRSLQDRVYAGTQSIVDRLGSNAELLFLAGDEYQAKVVELAFDALNPDRALDPRQWKQLAVPLAQQFVLFERALQLTQLSTYRDQFKNARYSFDLVLQNATTLGIPSAGVVDLDTFIPEAYGKGEFESPWTVEGLGHVYSQRVWIDKWGTSAEARGILTDGQAARLPDKSLTMMHAGLGLALAEILLKEITPNGDRRETDRVVRQFVQLCRNNSRPGYAGCAMESFGLETRVFHYRLVGEVQQALRDIDEEAWEFFWRGAGRGLYFSPGHAIQPVYSPWIAAEQEAPSERVLASLRSGLAWAANLVNMRTPRVFELLIQLYGKSKEQQAAIRQGVAASVTMAIDIVPNHAVVQSYRAYVPEDPEVRPLWKDLVHDPVVNAVERYHPILKANNMLDQVFRFQDIETLVSRLENTKSNRALAARG